MFQYNLPVRAQLLRRVLRELHIYDPVELGGLAAGVVAAAAGLAVGVAGTAGGFVGVGAGTAAGAQAEAIRASKRTEPIPQMGHRLAFSIVGLLMWLQGAVLPHRSYL
ncbi:MAG TPA: hypothetical protein VJO15_00485 [Dehalococcoidia bacterium]|nr:hypothetical protein [Dehalococcoidia bacterium]